MIKVGNVEFGSNDQISLIAGPCVIEDRKSCFTIAKKLCNIVDNIRMPFVFKASYDKANRTSVESFRGIGIEKGLETLKEIKERLNVPILTDVHSVLEVEKAAQVVDVLQIPAFLCRQTDLIVEAAKTQLVINIKKGQFLAPEEVIYIVQKIEKQNNFKILITERGTSFGYNNLVVDMRSPIIVKKFGYPIIFDATHSVQKGRKNGYTEGDSAFAPQLAKAAIATGAVDAIFLETHDNPEKAKSDKENLIPLEQVQTLLFQIQKIKNALK